MKLRKSIILVLVAILMATLAFAGCGTKKDNAGTANAKEGGTLNYQLGSNPMSLDPAHMQESEGTQVGKMLFNGLVKYNPKTGAVENDIADKIEKLDNGQKFKVTIKKGVKFSNGREVKAADFKYSWERVLLKSTASEISFPFAPIKGAKEMLDGKATTLEGVKVLGDYEFEITLTEPMANFVTCLGHQAMFVVAKEGVEKAGKNYGTANATAADLIGTGPFKFVEWKDGQTITVEKNKDYFGTKTHLDKVVFKIIEEESTAFMEYQAGNLDYLKEVPPGQVKAVKANPDYKDLYVQAPYLATYYYGFNVEKAPFKGNLKLRQAINYAIDRQAILDTVMEGVGKPTSGMLPDGAGKNPDLKGYKYDIEKAKKLLVEAGYPDGKGLPEITLTYNTNERHKAVAEAIQAQLKKIGVNIKLENLEWGAINKALSAGEKPFFRMGWVADYPDPDNFLYALFLTEEKGKNNYTMYGNPAVDKLLKQARQTTDDAKRLKIYQDAEQKIVDDAPMVWLYQYQTKYMVSKKVKGLVADGLNILHLESAWLE